MSPKRFVYSWDEGPHFVAYLMANQIGFTALPDENTAEWIIYAMPSDNEQADLLATKPGVMEPWFRVKL